MDHGLSGETIRPVQHDLANQPIEIAAHQAMSNEGGITFLERSGPQLRAEQTFVAGEVLPHRPADRVSGAVGAAEVIDDLGDQLRDDADVIDGEVAVSAD